MTTSTSEQVWVGIDVSKARLDIAVKPLSQRWSEANTPDGIAQLVEKLAAVRPAAIVMEATGGYEALAALSLSHAGLSVVVVNSRQVRDFAGFGPFSQVGWYRLRDPGGLWQSGSTGRTCPTG